MIRHAIPIREYFARATARKERREKKRLDLGLPPRLRKSKPDAAKKKRRTERSILVGQLDALFSQFIRTRDKIAFGGVCPFGHKNGPQKPIECCFHFLTRSKYSVRWDPRNACGACHDCNLENEYNPHRFVEWYLKTYGRRQFDAIVEKGHGLARFDNEDLRDIKADLTRKFERISVDRAPKEAKR